MFFPIKPPMSETSALFFGTCPFFALSGLGLSSFRWRQQHERANLTKGRRCTCHWTLTDVEDMFIWKWDLGILMAYEWFYILYIYNILYIYIEPTFKGYIDQLDMCDIWVYLNGGFSSCQIHNGYLAPFNWPKVRWTHSKSGKKTCIL